MKIILGMDEKDFWQRGFAGFGFAKTALGARMGADFCGFSFVPIQLIIRQMSDIFLSLVDNPEVINLIKVDMGNIIPKSNC